MNAWECNEVVGAFVSLILLLIASSAEAQRPAQDVNVVNSPTVTCSNCAGGGGVASIVGISQTGTDNNIDINGTVPVTGVFWQATQPVSFGSVTLVHTTVGNALAVRCVNTAGTLFESCAGSGGGGTLGQQTMANSSPVVIASDQSSIPINGIVDATGSEVNVVNDIGILDTAVRDYDSTGVVVNERVIGIAIPADGGPTAWNAHVIVDSAPSLSAGTNNIGDVDVVTLPAISISQTTTSNDVNLYSSTGAELGTATNPIRTSTTDNTTVVFSQTGTANDVDVLTLPAIAITNTGFNVTGSLPTGGNTIGNVNDIPPTLTKGTQGATGFSVQQLIDAGRNNITISANIAAPTVADTVFATTIKASQGVAAAGATSIVPAATKVMRILAATMSVRTTTAATPWAQVVLRMSNTTTCSAASSVVSYFTAGGTAAVIGNTGSISVDFGNGFELPTGGSFCISVSGSVTTNVVTFSAQGFEY